MMTIQRALSVSIGLSWMSACGGVKGNPKDDALVRDGSSPPRCDPMADFGTPIALTSLNTNADDERADLSSDELTMYFSSTRTGGVGGFDIYQATRMSSTAPFGNVVPVTGVNTAKDERGPRVTADGLSMFAYSRTSSVSPLHLMLA